MVDIVPFTSLLAGTGLGKTIYTANAVVLSTANGGVAVNSNIYVNSSGNVGIGTTIPGSTLDVNGNAGFRSAVSVAGTAIVNAAVSNVYGYFGQNVTVASGNASTSASSGALVVSNGGAGIAGNVYAGGNVVLATAGKQFWGTTSDTITNPSYSWAGDLQTGMFRPTSSTIAFTTGGTERMRIFSGGQVGIGTTTVGYNLDIGVNQNAATVLRVINQNSGASAQAVLQLAAGSAPGYANFTITSTYAQWVGAGGIATNYVDFDTQYWRNSSGTLMASLTKSASGTSGNLAVTGNVTATQEITAYFSDGRLKDNITVITNAVDKVMAINGVFYNPNELAQQLMGESRDRVRVGLIAQEVQAILPQVIRAAPFDTDPVTGTSKSGQDYMTIQYEKLVPLLVEAIKEQQYMIADLEYRIDKLEGRS